MVAAAGAGPRPIPQRSLNAAKLADAIRDCLTDEASVAAKGLAGKMRHEVGVRRAVASFHANLPLHAMRCDVFPSRPATWIYKKSGQRIKLSKAAAGLLVEKSALGWEDLKR